MTLADALEQVTARHGLLLRLDGRCPGGEVGAHYARSAQTGQRYVVKWSENAADAGRLAGVVERVNLLRTAGYPAPEYLEPFPIDGGVVVVQEAVPGAWRDDVDDDLIDTVLRLNGLQSGAVGGRGDGWTDYIRMTLTEGAEGYCIHETLRLHSDMTRRMLDWAQAVGRSLARLPEDDIVHVDFHHRNMLRDGAELTAVIDWEGCRTGDAAFDLVTFCFGFSHAVATPGTEARVWRHLQSTADPESLTASVAHMVLRRVDWTIRHHPDEVDMMLARAERHISDVTD